MSTRLLLGRWRLLAASAVLACGALGAGAGQAVASGVVQSFTVSPASTQAGGDSSVAFDLAFAYSASTDSVKEVTVQLAPGLLGFVANVPATCSSSQLASNTCPAGAVIGSGQATTTAGTVNATLYLMPAPSSNDIAAIGAALTGGPLGSLVVSGTGLLDIVTANGQPVGEIRNLIVPEAPSVQVTDIRVQLNGTTSNGQPFMRLPTSCSAATSSVTADTYQGNTGSNAGSFTPTGCSSLGYSPTLSAVVKKDSGDNGSEVIATISQPNAATESATEATVLKLGPSLSPNTGSPAVAACISGSPCTVGTASATSPILPSSDLSSGTVTLGGSPTAPTLTVAFPAPVAVAITGVINLSNDSVTFSNEPDFPLSSLVVDLTGPPGTKALTTSCAPGSVIGNFTAWSGATKTSTAAISYQGCSPGSSTGKATSAGSISGLATGKPKLHFSISAGSNAPEVSSFSIDPPGLSFHGCKKKGKKLVCKGLSVSGGKVKTVKLSGGRLTIVLTKAVSQVSVTVSGPMLTESKSLQSNVQKHKVKSLTFKIKVTDASGKTTTLSLKLGA
jgi:hypothetical protein